MIKTTAAVLAGLVIFAVVANYVFTTALSLAQFVA
jgi:hypothetical protein